MLAQVISSRPQEPGWRIKRVLLRLQHLAAYQDFDTKPIDWSFGPIQVDSDAAANRPSPERKRELFFLNSPALGNPEMKHGGISAGWRPERGTVTGVTAEVAP
jgi:hypothetical protein